jgi:hypothetical protein
MISEFMSGYIFGKGHRLNLRDAQVAGGNFVGYNWCGRTRELVEQGLFPMECWINDYERHYKRECAEALEGW